MGWIVGFEPTVSSATNWRFNQLSYTHHISELTDCRLTQHGALRGTRTPDPLLRRQMLYPAELSAHKNGAGDGNRTHTTSLEGWDSTIELHPHFEDGDYFSISSVLCQYILRIYLSLKRRFLLALYGYFAAAFTDFYFA